MHPACLPVDDLLEQCDMVRTRRGGPGGQHRNKVETAVVLMHRPTGIAAEASERRSQAENRRMACRRLRLRLALEHREALAVAGPSALWQARTSARQIAVSGEHDDYPALVAEALDHLQAAAWDMPRVAAELGVSASQLARLFRKSAAAWTALNAQRATHGLPRLR